MRDITPWSPPFPRDERPPDDLRPDDDLPPAEDVDRAELRGDLAADVLAVFDDEPDLAVRELPPLPLLPLEAVFDRADVVLRDEDDLELPLLDELLLDEPLLEPPLLLRDELLLLRPLLDDAFPPLRPAALFCAVLPPRLDELLLLLRDELPLLELRPPLDEAFPPLRPAALFCALLPPRLDELLPLLLLRPPLELFFVVEELPDDRLLFVAAAPFLPAALFCALLPPRLDEPLLVERELEPVFFAPPLDERELEPEDFLAPPDEDRDDDDELFDEPPLLLEPDDEREPLDFLVVAMQIIPPVVFGMILHEQRSAICVPFAVLY